MQITQHSELLTHEVAQRTRSVRAAVFAEHARVENHVVDVNVVWLAMKMRGEEIGATMVSRGVRPAASANAEVATSGAGERSPDAVSRETTDLHKSPRST